MSTHHASSPASSTASTATGFRIAMPPKPRLWTSRRAAISASSSTGSAADATPCAARSRAAAPESAKTKTSGHRLRRAEYA